MPETKCHADFEYLPLSEGGLRILQREVHARHDCTPHSHIGTTAATAGNHDGMVGNGK